MKTLTVALADRSYPIHIGRNLFTNVDLILPHLKRKSVAIVTNTTVAPLYLQKLSDALTNAGVKVIPIILPDGEAYKNSETLNLIYDALLQNRCERSTTLIALGGGVIGDLTGYAAATYLRGVPFIQIPTTCFRRWIPPLAAKPASTTRWVKIWLARFTNRNWY